MHPPPPIKIEQLNPSSTHSFLSAATPLFPSSFALFFLHPERKTATACFCPPPRPQVAAGLRILCVPFALPPRSRCRRTPPSRTSSTPPGSGRRHNSDRVSVHQQRVPDATTASSAPCCGLPRDSSDAIRCPSPVPGHLVVLNTGDLHFLPSLVDEHHQAFASSRIGSRSGDVRYDKFFCSFHRYEMMTLARLPFRLGLGRVMDATGYLQDS